MMKRKSPYVAAILNFFFMGLGYVYAGKRVGFGIGLFLYLFVYLAVTYPWYFDPIEFILSLFLGIIFAYDGYKTAQEVNLELGYLRSNVPSKPQYCPSCGSKLPSDALFCEQCGSKR